MKTESGAPPAIHSERFVIRYAECDQQGVAFNGNYLGYCDHALDRALRSGLGMGYRAFDWEFMLVRFEISWQGSVSDHDWLDVAVRPVLSGRTSFTVGYEGTSDSRHVFEATATYVGVVAGTKTPTPPPPAIRAVLGRSVAPTGR